MYNAAFYCEQRCLVSTTELPSKTKLADCVLCQQMGGRLVYENSFYRVIAVDANGPDAHFPAFYRLIWNQHVVEMTDLPYAQQLMAWQAISIIESCMRKVLQAHKMNLASFGNMVAHLHWHFIARFEWDSHFPNPVWGQALREVPVQQLQEVQSLFPQLDALLQQKLTELRPFAHIDLSSDR